MKQNLDNELQNVEQTFQADAVAPIENAVETSPFSTLDAGLKRIFGENFDINDEMYQEALLAYV